MTPSRRPTLLDLVAVLQSYPNVDVEVGDVGTVVELLPPDGLVVEFLDRDGRTLSCHVGYRGRTDAQPRTHTDKPGRVTVPGKMSDDVPIGTLKSILRQAGLEK